MAALPPQLKQATGVLAERGEGVHIHGADGRRYLDFTAGIGVTSTGHCHPTVVRAAQEQVGTLIHGQYTTVMHRPLLALTERLGEVLPPGLDSLFYMNSGSEAVEAAVRLARHATGRQNIVAFHGGFHGRTMGAGALTTSATKFRSGIGPMMPGVVIAPFPTAYRYGWPQQQATGFALDELDYLLTTVSSPEDTAAFIVEPVLGEGGYVPADAGFLRGLRERADRHGILLIRDEKLVENAAEQGVRLLGGLREVAGSNPSVGDVRGLGLMCASEFTGADGLPDPATASRAQQEAAARGLLLLTCGPLGNTVRM